jgi:3-phenylpropionate/cinnamic acid dioxygenase small subunit
VRETPTTDAAGPGTRVPARDPRFGDVYDFLVDEAALLDDDRFDEWLELVTDDVRYEMPARETRYRRDGAGFDPRGMYFADDRLALGLRVQRNGTIASAWDRDPAPRIRRLVTNVIAHEAGPDEYAVRSSVLLLRNRFDDPHFDQLAARREDVLRLAPEGLRLARRTIYTDQASMGAPFLSVLI